MSFFRFQVSGGVIAVTGLLLLFESGLLHPDVVTLLNKIKYSSVKFGLALQVCTFMMIAVGAIIMGIAVVGICGAWKKIKCCILVVSFQISKSIRLIDIDGIIRHIDMYVNTYFKQ